MVGKLRKHGSRSVRDVQHEPDGDRESDDVHGAGDDPDGWHGESNGDFGDGSHKISIGDNYDHAADSHQRGIWRSDAGSGAGECNGVVQCEDCK